MKAADRLCVERYDDNDLTVLGLDGELDHASAGRLPEAIAPVLREGRRLVAVDLRRVRVIDSIGISGLMAVRRRLWRHDGVVIFVCSQEPVGRLLSLMGIYDVLGCTDDFDGALVALRRCVTGG